MTGNLIRTTTYFDQDLLMLAKLAAVSTKRPFYEVVNEKLREAFKLPGIGNASKLPKGKFKFEEVFIVKTLGLGGKKIKRAWAYE